VRDVSEYRIEERRKIVERMKRVARLIAHLLIEWRPHMPVRGIKRFSITLILLLHDSEVFSCETDHIFSGDFSHKKRPGKIPAL